VEYNYNQLISNISFREDLAAAPYVRKKRR
jgi:hypothetical protein